MNGSLQRLTLVALAIGVVGCSGRYHVRATTASSAQLAYVDDGVWAVSGYPGTAFYSDGYYWRYDDGSWYRNYGLYDDGWSRVRVSVLPAPLLRIDRPYRYRNYVAPRGVRVRPAPRVTVRPRGYDYGYRQPRVRATPGRVTVRPRPRYDNRRYDNRRYDNRRYDTRGARGPRYDNRGARGPRYDNRGARGGGGVRVRVR